MKSLYNTHAAIAINKLVHLETKWS